MSITLPPLPKDPFGHMIAPVIGEYATAYALAAVELERASRVPMTDAQCKVITRAWSRSGVTNFHSIVRDTEAHHGIGAKS